MFTQFEVRRDKEGIYGCVEPFSIYKYINTHGELVGNIKTRVWLDIENKRIGISQPFVYRQKEFIPLAQIEEEMGIEKYIKAKKPIYSIVNGLLVDIKVSLNFNTGEVLESKTFCNIYSKNPNRSTEHIQGGDESKYKIFYKQVPISRDSALNDVLRNLVNKIAESKGDRIVYLRQRINGDFDNLVAFE